MTGCLEAAKAEREIKVIYHPKIAGAHTIKKDQGWLFFMVHCAHAKPTLASYKSHH